MYYGTDVRKWLHFKGTIYMVKCNRRPQFEERIHVAISSSRDLTSNCVRFYG